MNDTVAKFLIEELSSRGMDTYFGIPGGPIGPLFAAIYRTPGTTLIESKHETAALFEAIGYYKATGKIPVVLVTAGPGITNALTGIASAKALRVPVLVLCGDVSWQKSNHIMLQNGGPEGIDIEKTFAPHTDSVIRIKDPHTAIQEIVQLLSSRNNLAPSIVVLPLHINNLKIEKPKIRDIFLPQVSSKIEDDVLIRVSQLLQRAEHPLIVIGYGAYSCASEINQLINKLFIPFVTTPQAKGILDENHSLSLRHGGVGASQLIRKYIETTPDVVLALGTDLDDCSVGTTEYIGEQTKLIHIDLNSKVFNRKYSTEIGIVSDLKYFCDQFKAIEYLPVDRGAVQDIKNNISPFDVAAFREDSSFPIAPHRVLAELETFSPDNVRFVTDIGEHMLFCLHYLTITKDRKFSIDLGLGSMGSGICQAIGMCLGDRRPTICICGDGCFQMHGMEILTAIKHNLPIIFVVFNDARYNMVSHGFNFSFGIKENPGQTNYIDFVKLAEALGIKGAKITEAGQINSQMMEILLNNGPAILDVRINKEIRIKGAGRNEVLKHMGE